MIYRKAAGNDGFVLEYMSTDFSQCLWVFSGYLETKLLLGLCACLSIPKQTGSSNPE